MPEGPLLRVFLDADVLIAGSASTTGAAHVILQLGELKVIQAISSAQARDEAERNLAAKLPDALAPFRALADAACTWVPDPPPRRRAGLRGKAHPKDVPILAAAVEARCAFLVTFNVRDFRPGDLLAVENPGAFLDRLRSHLEALGLP